MSRDGKLLRCRIPLCIRCAVDLALGPFKFLEPCSDPGQNKLDLFGSQIELGDYIFIAGAVGIVLDGELDQGICLMVILLIFTFCVELCIMGQRRAFQLVIDGDQLPVGLYFADLRGYPRLIILIHESMSLLSKYLLSCFISYRRNHLIR